MFQSYGSLQSLRAWHDRMTSSQHAAAGMAAAVRGVQCAMHHTAARHQQPAGACSSRLMPRQRPRLQGTASSGLRMQGSWHRPRRRSATVWAVGNPPPPPPPPPDDDSGFGAGEGGFGSGDFDGGEQGGAAGGDLTPEEAGRFGGGRDSVGRAQQAAEAGMVPPPDPPPPFRQRTRLAEALLAAPSRTDRYFDDNPGRRLLWLAIAFASGFYCANTVSLSFGTLAVNDVVAAAVTVGFCEAVSYTYYQAETVTYPLALANSFKMGVIAALITDARKLQS